MPPRFTIDRLPEEQFQFVVDAINSGASDREICAAFEKQFETPLARSSLERWRKASGDELAQGYRLARYQATQLLENLEETDADKLSVIMATVENRLLTSMRQITSEDPLKLLAACQKEGDRRLKERMLELKEREFAVKLERERLTETMDRRRLQIGIDTWQMILDLLKARNPGAFAILAKHTKEIATGLGVHLSERFPNVIQAPWTARDAPQNPPVPDESNHDGTQSQTTMAHNADPMPHDAPRSQSMAHDAP
jgi:hypothetical protein